MKRSVALFILSMLFAATAHAAPDARQADLEQMSRELTAKSEADRAAAHRLAAEKGWQVRGYGEEGSYFELQRIVNGFPRFYTTFNSNAAITTRANLVNAAIGGGSGFVLRLWDGGKPRTTHREYSGRITWADTNPSSVAGHATHVAGTMIASGVLPGAKGMSYAATIRAFEWNNDAGEMTSEASAGANLSNHSYGYIGGWFFNTSNGYWYWYGDTAVSEVEDYNFGFYDEDSRLYDQIANAAPNYLVVVSSSNDRDDYGPPPGTKHYYWDSRFGTWRFSTKTRNPDGTPTGYDCIPMGFQISKNTLTVGAVHDVLSYTGPGSVVLADFSSTGPCDDGRIKPDVVGNGMELLSSYSTHDSSYATANGTSMSSPNVCGSLGLLADYYKDANGGTPMWASTLKGLAIHTAREAGLNPGPDYEFGWGLLDTYAAYQLIVQDNLYPSKGLVEELTLSNGQTIELGYRVYGAPPELRVTICWNDPAANPPSRSLDPATRMLLNDLDLRILGGGSTHQPWRLDRLNPSNAATRGDNNIDNIEQVVITAPTAGALYTIRINHKGTLTGGSQKVSLVVSGAEKNHLWHVYEDGSGDAPTIAAAVTAAVDGDTIYVHQGTYAEAGISVGKALLIRGVDGAALTTVNAASLGNGCFVFPSASKTIRFDGFTLTGGTAPISGGGISCSNSQVTIENCVIKACSSTYYGGGLSVINASPTVRNCSFIGNVSQLSGGGVYLYGSSSVIDSCVLHGNRSNTANGGGVYVGNGSPQLRNCTINACSLGTGRGAVYIDGTGSPVIQRCIVSFCSAEGIYGASGAGLSMSCSDIFGNAGGNYGGSISDQTGVNDNISADPLYCGAGAVPPDLAVSVTSPCAAANSPCGQRIGALGVGCTTGPDLVIGTVLWSDTKPALGDSVRAAVTIKNTGGLPALRFFADHYLDSDTLPPNGALGDERLFIDSLAAGDSLVWTTAWQKAVVLEKWTSWFRVDTGDSVLEANEANNTSGPHEILWRIPFEPMWPVDAGSGSRSSPAIASIDDDEGDLEIVIGFDDGTLRLLKGDGTPVTGWPVSIGDTIHSSPAVADIAGDYRKEIVVGGRDGKLYAFDRGGTKLWEYPAGSPIYATPALADLDGDGKCEVIFSSGGGLYALDGGGNPFAGSWPVLAGAGVFTSPAVGDIDGDGALEVAAVAYGVPDAASSLVYLLNADGTSYGVSWPVTADTVISADPVLGKVQDPASDLDIVAGGLNGRVYVWNKNGVLWGTSSTVPGAIETAPALANMDADDNLEIVVTSRSGSQASATAIDHTGGVMAGWPRTWASAPAGIGTPSAILIGSRIETMLGDPADSLRSWQADGVNVYGFPIDLAGDVLASAAADDIDRDGNIELIVAGGGWIHCFELPAADYSTGDLFWPMFRHDRARTGCYESGVPTPVDENRAAVPAATAIRSLFPNPFNPWTKIAFDVSRRSRVELAIYDVLGRQVAVLVGRELDPGRYEVTWDGRAASGGTAASGVYFCRLKAGRHVETRKMVLLR